MPVKLPVELPTPPELSRDPELAAMALLETALNVTAYAIIAGNMDLCAQDEDYVDEQSSPSLLTARDILEKMEVLERDLERYRKQRMAEALARLPHPFDF